MGQCWLVKNPASRSGRSLLRRLAVEMESTKNCGAHLMLQVRTRTLDGTLRGSSSSGIRLKAGARSVEAEPCIA